MKRFLTRLAIVSAIALTFYHASTLLSKVKPFKIQELLDKDHPVRVAYETYKKDFNDEPRAFLLIKKKSGQFTTEEIHTVGQTLKHEMEQNKYILKITSPVDASYVSYENNRMKVEPFLDGAEISPAAELKLTEEFYKNTTFNTDRSALMFYVDFIENIPDSEEYGALDQFVQMGKKFENIWPSITIHPMGTKVANFYFTQEMILNQSTITPLLLLAIAFFIFFMYRSFQTIAYILLIMVLGYVATLATIISVENGLGPYSMFALFFVFIVSSADLFHYFSKLANNAHQSSNAIYDSVKLVIWPSFLTSLANAIGFGSLMANENVLIRNFGFYCTVGIAACFILTFGLLPWMMTVFSFNPKSLYVTPMKVDGNKVWRLLHSKNRLILTVSLGVFIVLLGSGYNLRIDDNVYDSFVKSHDMTKSVKHYTDEFSFMGSVDVVFHGKNENIRSQKNEKLMGEFEQDLLALPHVSYLKSYTQLMNAVRSEIDHSKPEYLPAKTYSLSETMFTTLNSYRVFRSLYSDNSEKMRSVLFLRSLHSDDLTSTLDSIKQLAQNPKYSKSIDVSANGFSVIRNYVNSSVIKNFVSSFVPSFFLIFLVFCFIFRSFKWGLLCMIPNLYPLVTISGLMGIFNVTMESNLVILVCITLGLCVDDTIHFACGLQDGLKRGISFEKALMECFRDTSDALIATTLNIVVSFPVFFIGDLRLYAQVGIFILFSLIVGLLADFIVFPAVLLRCGKSIFPTNSGKDKQQLPQGFEVKP